MSRMTAILLLPIMVIFAIQPVIAMHYCGGELQSLNLFAQQTNTDISPVHAASHRNHYSCCDSPRTEAGRHDCEWHTTGDECCDIELLELTTDDYQNKVENQISRPLSFSIDNMGVILTRLFKLSDSETNISTPHPDFPPEGLFLKDVSLLTYICIYRI